MSVTNQLSVIADEAAVCVACGLAETRTQVVFGAGAFDADVMFIGEAPGRNEDLQGEPFVGAAGRLLERLLAEIGMKREDVYIANVLKCRPPGNRDPRPDEIEACKGYLRSQIELVDPKVVVTLGNFATKLLLKRTVGITRLRGQIYPWWHRRMVPTFHPAAALRGGDRVTDLMRADLALVAGILAETHDSREVSDEPTTEQLGLFG